MGCGGAIEKGFGGVDRLGMPAALSSDSRARPRQRRKAQFAQGVACLSTSIFDFALSSVRCRRKHPLSYTRDTAKAGSMAGGELPKKSAAKKRTPAMNAIMQGVLRQGASSFEMPGGAWERVKSTGSVGAVGLGMWRELGALGTPGSSTETQEGDSGDTTSVKGDDRNERSGLQEGGNVDPGSMDPGDSTEGKHHKDVSQQSGLL